MYFHCHKISFIFYQVIETHVPDEDECPFRPRYEKKKKKSISFQLLCTEEPIPNSTLKKRQGAMKEY